MAKGKGGGKNYRPIKNRELLGGKKDGRPISEKVINKKDEVRKGNETWQELATRKPQKFQIQTKEEAAKKLLDKRIAEIKQSKAQNEMQLNKNQVQDKEKDKANDFDIEHD